MTVLTFIDEGYTCLTAAEETLSPVFTNFPESTPSIRAGVLVLDTPWGQPLFRQALIEETMIGGLLCLATAPKPYYGSAQAARRVIQSPQTRKPQHLHGRTCMNSAELAVPYKKVPVLLGHRRSSRSESKGVGLETGTAERQWKQKLQSNPLPSKNYQAVHHQCTEGAKSTEFSSELASLL